MKNQGISLISLIITIIVIIILAAIVIFSGLNTPDSAQFAGFTQQVDNVYSAVMGKYGELKAKHAISGDYRTDEQIYLEIANGQNAGQYYIMNNDGGVESTSAGDIAGGNSATTARVAHIVPDNAKIQGDYNLGMTLPTVRQQNNAWYITRDGRVFNANGFTYDKKTYFSGSVYYGEEIQARAKEDDCSDRAAQIWTAIADGTNNIVETVNDAKPNA